MLTVENVFLTLGHKQVLRGLNLSFEKGKAYGIIGQNGAGKSSIAYLLMGLERYKPDKGKIIFGGEDITPLSVYERAKRGITLAWQEPARFEGLSIKDFLTLGNRYSHEEAGEYLKLVGLDPERYLNREIDDSLSGGERKRVEMASVLMVKPEVVILDEPDSGIDIGSYEKVVQVVDHLKKNGSIVVVITHNNIMLKSMDYAYLICNGVAYREGAPGDIQEFYEDKCDSCAFVDEGGEIIEA
ncbi:ATP-binding cassette domain-containing protein [Halothermothrix orenii]|uniref:ABC transporter related n=1 Tax=Halothermothrix orenii (strain H 168 / OCM 544 / DSM 9562) TaxID=373903 RepID=B8CZ41_HALOH|nr:ATP-binding cassette domain-containing protein [Halothermothrix orenii]ACL70560.1 ABC transporter related [Halothermothrix orenii H 168]